MRLHDLYGAKTEEQAMAGIRALLNEELTYEGGGTVLPGDRFDPKLFAEVIGADGLNVVMNASTIHKTYLPMGEEVQKAFAVAARSLADRGVWEEAPDQEAAFVISDSARDWAKTG